MMYPRKGNSCSYLVQFCAHGRKCYGRVVCYILFLNVALITEYGLTGLNICQDLPLPQDVVLKEIVHRNLIGQHFLQVQEIESLLLVKCADVINRCLHVQGEDGKGFITFLDTPYEHD